MICLVLPRTPSSWKYIRPSIPVSAWIGIDITHLAISLIKTRLLAYASFMRSLVQRHTRFTPRNLHVRFGRSAFGLIRLVRW